MAGRRDGTPTLFEGYPLSCFLLIRHAIGGMTWYCYCHEYLYSLRLKGSWSSVLCAFLGRHRELLGSAMVVSESRQHGCPLDN